MENKSARPVISVVVPVYNTEKYLHRCVDSILAQTFTDFELLLIDDGSQDESGNICDSYVCLDSRVRVFHKTNGGVSSARNLGLDKARGEWVTFCDSDDWAFSSWLQNFINEFELGVELICQGFKKISMGKCDESAVLPVVDRESTLPINETIYYISEAKMLGYVWNKIFKKDIIRRFKIIFDEDLKFREDEIFVLEYAQHITKAKSVVSIGYVYNEPDWDNKYSILYNNINLLNKRYYLLKHLKCNPDMVRWALQNLIITSISFLVRHTENKSQIVKILIDLIKDEGFMKVSGIIFRHSKSKMKAIF